MKKLVKRFLSMVLAAVLFAAMLPVDALAEGERAVSFAGEGTEESPYQIETKEQLDAVRSELSANYILMNDITFTEEDFAEGGAFYNDGAGFAPIGDASTPFTGVFDGDGHKITGLYQNITSTGTAYAGLFGYVSNGTVKNIERNGGRTTVIATSSVYAGGIVGYCDNCTISDSDNNSDISAISESDSSRLFAYVGGIAGKAGDNTYLERCRNGGNIEAQSISSNNESNAVAGGIAGYAGGTVTSCCNTGDISCSSSQYDYAGGILGRGNGTIDRCCNSGNINTTAVDVYTSNPVAYAAGIAGYYSGVLSNRDNAISNCFNAGDVLSGVTTSHAGGIAAAVSGAMDCCYNVGAVCSSFGANDGGIADNANNAELSGCFYIDRIRQGINKGTDTTIKLKNAQMQNADSFVGFDFDSIWTMEGDKNYPYPELRGSDWTFEKTIVEGFAGGTGMPFDPYIVETKDQLDLVREDMQAYYRLANDISFTEEDFAENGRFYNDGAGFLSIGDYENSSSCFNGEFDGNGHKIIGFVQRRAKNNSINVGLFGCINYGVVKNLGMENGKAEGYTASAGAITCSLKGTIINCYNTGIVSSSKAGGIAGIVYETGKIISCYNLGDIEGGMAGGIAAAIEGGIVDGCYNKGTIKAESYIQAIAGGIAAKAAENGLITNCYNTGSVFSASTSDTVEAYCGGIAGNVAVDGKIFNCYNTGSVNATAICGARAGGIAGNNAGIIENAYYSDRIAQGVGLRTDTTVKLTKEQMKSANSFAGFDFDSVWTMDGNEAYPYPELISIPNNTVYAAQISIACDADTVFKAETIKVTANVLPESADDTTVAWSVINGTGEATIDVSGLLTAKKAGTVTVRATATDGSGVYGEKQITVMPDTPIITSAASAGYASVKLTWSEVEGASGYCVYRTATKDGEYAFIGRTTGTSYTNKSLVTGTTYYYKVRAYVVVEDAEIYGEYSETASAKPIPVTPTLKAASAGYASVKLTWNKVAGASGYYVYRSTAKSGTYSYIGKTTGTSYTNAKLTTGKTYYYKVRAYRTVDGKNVFGNYSAYKSAKPVPATPALTLKKASSTSITASWGKVMGASGYVVYRSTSKTGKYSAVKTITSGSTVSFTNTKLAKGKTYYYKVRAYRTVSGKRVYGGYSTVKYIKM